MKDELKALVRNLTQKEGRRKILEEILREELRQVVRRLLKR